MILKQIFDQYTRVSFSQENFKFQQGHKKKLRSIFLFFFFREDENIILGLLFLAPFLDDWKCFCFCNDGKNNVKLCESKQTEEITKF